MDLRKGKFGPIKIKQAKKIIKVFPQLIVKMHVVLKKNFYLVF